MRFALSPDQEQIKRTARDFLQARCAWPTVRASAESGRYDDALWGEVAGLGWPGTTIDEAHDGLGMSMIELVLLIEELGYHCAPVPFLGSVLAADAIQLAGSPQQQATWLPRLAAGEARGAFGLTSSGVASLVPDAVGADVVVLLDAEARAATLVQGGSVEPLQLIDSTRSYGRVGTAGEPLTGPLDGMLARALVAVSAELVGVMQRALDMTVEFAKERKQFGSAIGSFQAVQHKAAGMLLNVEGGRSATYFAAWAADAAPRESELAAATAKAWTSDAARAATGTAIQLHGGIGFTWEADLHWLFKRAQVDALFLGAGGQHRRDAVALLATRLAETA